MFLHNQSRFATELQGDVVPRNTTVLPADPRAVSGMQERFALHVPRWNLFELFSWSKSIREVRYLYQQLCLTAFSFSVFRSNTPFSYRFFHSILNLVQMHWCFLNDRPLRRSVSKYWFHRCSVILLDALFSLNRNLFLSFSCQLNVLAIMKNYQIIRIFINCIDSLEEYLDLRNGIFIRIFHVIWKEINWALTY